MVKRINLFTAGPRHWRTGWQRRPRSFLFADEEVALMRDFNDADAEDIARALRDALKAKAIEITHAEALELIAEAFGYESWSILSAKIEAGEIMTRMLHGALK